MDLWLLGALVCGFLFLGGLLLIMYRQERAIMLLNEEIALVKERLAEISDERDEIVDRLFTDIEGLSSKTDRLQRVHEALIDHSNEVRHEFSCTSDLFRDFLSGVRSIEKKQLEIEKMEDGLSKIFELVSNDTKVIRIKTEDLESAIEDLKTEFSEEVSLRSELNAMRFEDDSGDDEVLEEPQDECLDGGFIALMSEFHRLSERFADYRTLVIREFGEDKDAEFVDELTMREDSSGDPDEFEDDRKTKLGEIYPFPGMGDRLTNDLVEGKTTYTDDESE